MGTGTPSLGRHTGKRTHIACRRCGQQTYHMTKKICSSCGYGSSAKLRSYKWSKK